MMNLSPTRTLLLIFWLHFFADYYLQPRFIANNKNKRFDVLLLHCIIYALCLMPVGWKFATVSACLHFLTDAITSRLSHYYWDNKMERSFFLILGLDQTIHMSCLLIVYNIFC